VVIESKNSFRTVALKQGPDDTLVLTAADEVLVLMDVGEALLELDDALLELNEVLVEVDRLKVLVLRTDDSACEDDKLVLADVAEDIVKEHLFPLPLPLLQ
jgi:GTP-sensing pleiotropic transcriptional regulator CodY